MLPLACLFTWSYNAFPALLGVAGCFVLAERLRDGRWYWPPLSYTAAGIGLGIFVNPYFPKNLRFMFHHYGDKLGFTTGVPVGSEWHPFPLTEWLGWTTLVAMLVGFATLLYRRRATWSTEELATTLAALLFLVLTWRASRFLEYFVPFAAVAAAMRWQVAADTYLRGSTPRLRRLLASTLAFWLTVTTVIAAVQMRSRPPSDLYRGASTWIRNHSSPGDLVFNVAWDDFPLLYFNNPSLGYVIGLDPTYLASRDADLYRQWENIRLGVAPSPARTVQTHFGAHLAVASVEEELFIKAMDDDRTAARAYSDEQSVVYRLSDPPEAPPVTKEDTQE
jgi:asparagine N-glycosylation enzyme membrane subunit Stt3